MNPIISLLISFHKFKHSPSLNAVIYGNNRSGLYHVYFGLDENHRYKHRIILKGAAKQKTLRAAYYLLFLCTDHEQEFVQTGEFQVSISYGTNLKPFQTQYFTLNYFREMQKEFADSIDGIIHS